jgi:hypothetical protein
MSALYYLGLDMRKFGKQCASLQVSYLKLLALMNLIFKDS